MPSKARQRLRCAGREGARRSGAGKSVMTATIQRAARDGFAEDLQQVSVAILLERLSGADIPDDSVVPRSVLSKEACQAVDVSAGGTKKFRDAFRP